MARDGERRGRMARFDEWEARVVWIIVVYANGDETMSFRPAGITDVWWMKSGLARG